MGSELLNQLLVDAGCPKLLPEQWEKFDTYLNLILRWNAKINLTAIRDREGILSRHFVESIACASSLPTGFETLLDFGSGAGLPGIPIAIYRPDLAVTLSESQGKKAAFLREAVRQLELNVKVFSGRAETLREQFGCVTLRAVDRMERALEQAVRLVPDRGWIAAMTTRTEAGRLQAAGGIEVSWSRLEALPGEQRVLLLGQRHENNDVSANLGFES